MVKTSYFFSIITTLGGQSVKKFLSILMLLTLLVGCGEKGKSGRNVITLEEDQVSISSGIVYSKETNEPFTGIVIAEGNEAKVSLKNGLQDGVTETYFPDGSIKAYTEMVQGEPHGTCRAYYPNGTLGKEQVFYAGRAEGEKKEWYESGELKRKSYFYSGIQDDVASTFYKNGSVKIETHYEGGAKNGEEKFFDESGNLEKTLYWVYDQERMESQEVSKEDYDNINYDINKIINEG